MNLAIAPLASVGIPDDSPVLATAPLRPGFSRDALSRYGDASWDLAPVVFRENARRCHVTVHFGTVPDLSVARCLREYLYARLNVDLPGIRPPLPPASLRQIFNRARRFFEFVRAELGSCDLARVDQGLLDRYARLLRNGRCRPVIVALLLEVAFDLHAYRAYLPTAALAVEPWPGRSRS
ncbi:MAG TPA: integrase, partial [Acetobacteraceae bacterium]|nr:integrase [Acetobacteraceae bacterium]